VSPDAAAAARVVQKCRTYGTCPCRDAGERRTGRGELRPYKSLLEVLREDLNLTGTKHGCELGECGACAVLKDGRPILSCLLLAVECEGADIVTVEGLADDARLHPLQEAFADCGAAQCGYCTPGFLVTAKALLDEKPEATRAEIASSLAGNLCRCTGYIQIFEAVERAAKEIARR
jgi:aerobic-type carbon monoxide dehydrogenase small subunit (CoxS/CutS family)